MQLVECYRIVTFVPKRDLEALVKAVCDSGFLDYGHYGDVLWFSSEGTGQFKPLSGANPAIGSVGQRERVAENRIEFSIVKDEAKLDELLKVVTTAHPYEEPAIHISNTRETRSAVK